MGIAATDERFTMLTEFTHTAHNVTAAVTDMWAGWLVMVGFLTLMWYDERLTNWVSGRTPEVIAAENAAAQRIKELRAEAAEACALAVNEPTEQNMRQARIATARVLCEIASQSPSHSNLSAASGALAAAE
jgi:hypothetical protein